MTLQGVVTANSVCRVYLPFSIPVRRRGRGWHRGSGVSRGAVREGQRETEGWGREGKRGRDKRKEGNWGEKGCAEERKERRAEVQRGRPRQWSIKSGKERDIIIRNGINEGRKYRHTDRQTEIQAEVYIYVWMLHSTQTLRSKPDGLFLNLREARPTSRRKQCIQNLVSTFLCKYDGGGSDGRVCFRIYQLRSI